MAASRGSRKRIRRGLGKRRLHGQSFCVADEVRYIQRRAAEYDGRFVTIDPLALFSTATGDAWLLDSSDRLALCLARNGDPESVHIEETDTRFAIRWEGHYHIDGEVFVFSDRVTGRVTTILGYPVRKIAQLD